MYLGIDLGTGSSKAVLTDANGQILAKASVPHRVSRPKPGWAEFEADVQAWAEIGALTQLIEQKHGPLFGLQGVCVSAMGPCLVLTDSDLNPVRPAILYGVDSRAAEQIRQLEEELGTEEILRDSGSMLSSQAIGPKVLWVKQNEPESYAKATRIFGLNSYVVARLTGAYVQDRHSASQSDPLYSLENHDWNESVWAAICPELEKPGLAWASDVVGNVHAEAAKVTGIPEGTPVVAGTIDAWAEALSAGVSDEGDTMLMYGSTFFIVQQTASARRNPSLWLTEGLFENQLTLAAGTSTSGSLTVWLQELFGGPSFEDLVEEAGRTNPGADGLLLVPYFAGERTPIQDPKARGTMVGLTLSHTRGHIFRAAYEGIAFGLRQILDVLTDDADKPRRLIAVGGGTQARLWAQIVSDVTGQDQQIPAERIGASYGDALLAAIGTGAADPSTRWAQVTETIVPDSVHREVYDTLYEQFSALYPATKDIMHAVADLQG